MSTSCEPESARIHLRLVGEDQIAEVGVPTGPRSLLDMLSPIRSLTDQATLFILERYRQAGRPSSCRAGCGACCRHLVAISLPEAVDLADVVAEMPAERQAVIRARFRAAVEKLQRAGLLEEGAPGQRSLLAEYHPDQQLMRHKLSQRYFAQQIPCPFLDNESCGIYERRPAVCREHHVITPPEECSRPSNGKVLRIEDRLDVTSALARATGHLRQEPSHTIPLVLALEWAAAHGAALRQTHDGVELFRRLIEQLDPQSSQPFDDRPQVTGAANTHG